MRDVARVMDTPAQVPERKGPGTRVRVFSGKSGDVEAPAGGLMPPLLLDIHMATRSSFTQEIPAGYDGFIFVLAGSITAGTRTLNEGQVGWLDDGEGPMEIQAGPIGGRAVLCAGPQSAPRVSAP